MKITPICYGANSYSTQKSMSKTNSTPSFNGEVEEAVFKKIAMTLGDGLEEALKTSISQNGRKPVADRFAAVLAELKRVFGETHEIEGIKDPNTTGFLGGFQFSNVLDKGKEEVIKIWADMTKLSYKATINKEGRADSFTNISFRHPSALFDIVIHEDRDNIISRTFSDKALLSGLPLHGIHTNPDKRRIAGALLYS